MAQTEERVRGAALIINLLARVRRTADVHALDEALHALEALYETVELDTAKGQLERIADGILARADWLRAEANAGGNRDHLDSRQEEARHIAMLVRRGEVWAPGFASGSAYEPDQRQAGAPHPFLEGAVKDACRFCGVNRLHHPDLEPGSVPRGSPLPARAEGPEHASD